MNLVLGLDPGFASIGYAIVELRNDGDRVYAMGVLRTSKSNKKRKVLAADDNVRRCREIARAMRLLCGGLAPGAVSNGVHNVRAVAAEAMSFPRNASTAAKVAMAWGVIVCESEMRRLPLIQASPQEVKLHACGRKDASKEDVAKAMLARFKSSAKKINKELDAIPASLHEHAWDALAAASTCMDSDLIKLVRGLA